MSVPEMLIQIQKKISWKPELLALYRIDANWRQLLPIRSTGTSKGVNRPIGLFNNLIASLKVI
jgi:hypothetical protein